MAKSDKGQQASDTVVLESEVGTAHPAKKTTKKKAASKKKKTSTKKAAAGDSARGGAARVKYPKHSILDCIRIPQAIIDQNAGEACTDREGAGYAKIGRIRSRILCVWDLRVWMRSGLRGGLRRWARW
jgi:hypothetical protein